MLDQIRRFFETYIQPSDDQGTVDREQAMRCATAALMLEMTHMERTDSAQLGRELVAELVRDDFALPPGEVDDLLACAEAERREATDYFQFTRLINDHFTPEEKIGLIESLWRVAYADKRLSSLEEHLVRKVAELIYVPHAAFISAKHRAEAERGVD
jgi:uncharacterized tellurite resistance protein B-like protein